MLSHCTTGAWSSQAKWDGKGGAWAFRRQHTGEGGLAGAAHTARMLGYDFSAQFGFGPEE